MSAESKVAVKYDAEGNPVFFVDQGDKNSQKVIFFDISLLTKILGDDLVLSNLSDLYGGQIFYGRQNGRSTQINFCKIIREKKDNIAIQKQIVRTLAHEARHFLQSKFNFTKKSAVEKVIFSKGFGAVMVVIFVFSLISVFVSLWSLLRGSYLSFLISYFFFIVTFLSGYPLYYYDPQERDARAFEKEALKNQEWLQIVRVWDIAGKID